MVSYIVRPATADDAQSIVDLIMELAVYEKMESQVKITPDQLRTSGLSADVKPWFHAKVVALVDDEAGERDVVGYTIYFMKHDIIQNTSIVYMEDLYVRPSYRGQGMGMALWRAVAVHGLSAGCSALNFAVLAWNSSSIEFYKKFGAKNRTEHKGVTMYRLSRETIETIETPAAAAS